MHDPLPAAARERQLADVWRRFARQCRAHGDDRMAAEAGELALLHERHAILLDVVRLDRAA